VLVIVLSAGGYWILALAFGYLLAAGYWVFMRCPALLNYARAGAQTAITGSACAVFCLLSCIAFFFVTQQGAFNKKYL
jgi:hypothetical protein